LVDTRLDALRVNAAHRQERIAKALLFSCAVLFVVAIAAVLVYLTSEGLKLFTVDKISPFEFLFSSKFEPEDRHPGALVFIAGSLTITAFAILVGGPIGVAVGVFFAELATPRVASIFKPAIEVLVGIPSVVYGWIGLSLLVPLIRNTTGSPGFGLLAAGIVLAVMILPTVVSLSEDAMRAVPASYREGSLALGSTRFQMIWEVLLPAASSGLAVAIILGIARAIGETLAVQMVIGNSPVMVSSLLSPTGALPAQIVIEMASAPQGSILQHALFSMALLLLFIAMSLIVLIRFVLRKK
jgi:phosphate transport system permease protein